MMGRGTKLMVDHSAALTRKSSTTMNIISIATHKKAVESMDVSPNREDKTFLTTVNVHEPKTPSDRPKTRKNQEKKQMDI